MSGVLSLRIEKRKDMRMAISERPKLLRVKNKKKSSS